MPAQTFVPVTKESAVKVATGITAGQLRIVKRGGPNARWFYAVVPTGDPAPAEAEFRGGGIFNGTDAEAITHPQNIDVYVWLRGSQDGELRLEA